MKLNIDIVLREGGREGLSNSQSTHLVQIVYTTGVFNWCEYFTPQTVKLGMLTWLCSLSKWRAGVCVCVCVFRGGA